MFRGSKQFPNGIVDRLVSREGGYWNAFTWFDYTAYYETLPSSKIGLALAIEADRMRDALLLEEDVEAERQIVMSERQMYENDPDFVLGEALNAAAFRVHPYHHEIIGDMVDLAHMTPADLVNHYRQYYRPNNAVVVAVGDFETGQMLAEIETAFGAIEAGEAVTAVWRQEPPQNGERHVTVHGPGDAAYLLAAYRAPAALDADYFPFVLLNAAFAGGSSLGMFGGGGSNKSSRLYKALVATGLAASAHGGLNPTIDPFLYTIQLIVQAGHTLAEVEAALDAELERLATTPITQAELDRAMKRAKVEFVMAGESMTGQAQLLGMAEVVTGDYGWFETVLERLQQVTLADVERVRQQYLQKRFRTVGWYEPEANPNDSEQDD